MTHITPSAATNRKRGISGSFPSTKMGQMVRYSSTLERDILFLLEFDTDVLRYTAQPFTIESLQPDEKVHKYTPDYYVVRRSRDQLIECKPATKVLHSHTQQQINIGTEWAEKNDCDFKLVTEVDLYTGHTLANLKILYRFRSYPVPYDQMRSILSLLKLNPEGIDGETISKHLFSQFDGGKSSQLFSQLCYLLFRHIVCTDMDAPLGINSTIFLGTKES